MYQINNFLGKKDLIFKILLFSLFVKLTVLYFLGAYTFLDGQTYIKLAKEIYNNSFIFPNTILDDAFFTPFLLSFFVPLEVFFGISAYAIPMVLISIFTIFILYKISLLVFNDMKIANIVGIILSIYPFLIFYSISILTETPFIFFLYLSLFFLTRFFMHFKMKDLLYFSIFFAFASLTRFIAVPIFFVFIGAILIVVFLKSREMILKSFLILIFGYFLVMSPWIVRNFKISKELVLTSPTEKAGYAFYIGNNHMNKTGGGNGWDANLSKYRIMKDQKEANKLAYQESINWIKNNPSDWILLEGKKFIRFFNPIFNTDYYNKYSYNIISLSTYGIVLLFFILGLLRSRKYLLLLSPMLFFTLNLIGIHMVLFASIRYRLPIEPMMIIIASFYIKRKFLDDKKFS
jgi:hypothetical protein